VSDHRSLVSGDWLEVRVYPTSVGVSIYYREIATRKRTELERETTIDFLRLINESETLVALADAATAFFGRQSGCEAVGLRLRDGDDYPYFTTHGLPPEFVALERSLIARDAKGQVCRDAAGHATLECLCGDVVGGRLDPSADYATARGSFWSNDTTQLLATIDQDARQAPLRGRCMSEGYQSVALVGLRVGEERLGLLQLNDRRKGCFAPEDIELWERLADQLAIAISKLRLEEELHDSRGRERFLAEVVEDAAAPFGVGSPDGRLLFFNQAFADLTGYSRQELESKAITWAVDLTPKRWRKPEAAQLADAVRHRRPVRYEKEYRRKDGRLVPVEAFVQPVFDASGTLVHYRSFMTDISRRKATQQERRRAELDRQRLFEDSQTQAEELRTQGEELRLQNDELVAQRDAIARESELRAGLNAISALLHSTLETDEVLRLTLREATRVLGVDGAAIELRAGDAWPVRYAHGLPDDALGRPLIDEALIARLVAGTGEPSVHDERTVAASSSSSVPRSSRPAASWASTAAANRRAFSIARPTVVARRLAKSTSAASKWRGVRCANKMSTPTARSRSSSGTATSERMPRSVAAGPMSAWSATSSLTSSTVCCSRSATCWRARPRTRASCSSSGTRSAARSRSPSRGVPRPLPNNASASTRSPPRPGRRSPPGTSWSSTTTRRRPPTP
jgi:PAS domain S-box-containing protein